MINVFEMKDDELLEFNQKMTDIFNKRQNDLEDAVNIEILKVRKVISREHEKCDKLRSLKDHVNPEYKLLMETVNKEIVKRKLKI